MERLACLLLISLLAFGCDSSGSNNSTENSKQDVSYKAGVIEGWKEGDSLRFEYAKGYDSENGVWEYERKVVTESEFSTNESVDLSQSDNDICIRARFISSRFFEENSQASAVLRMELRTENQSVDNQFDMGDGGVDQASVCIDGEADE